MKYLFPVRMIPLLGAVFFGGVSLIGAPTSVIVVAPGASVADITPLRRAFQEAACKIEYVSLRAIPELDGVDILVFGSGYPRDIEFRVEIFAKAAQLTKFLERGGVILDCAAEAPIGYWPNFLPLDNKMEVVEEPFTDFLVLQRSTPVALQMLASLAPAAREGMQKLPASLIRKGFIRQRGFRVIAAHDSLGMHAFLLETAVVNGRGYVCTLPLDSTDDSLDEQTRELVERMASGLCKGLLAAVQEVKSGKITPFVPDLGADAPEPRSWRIIVLPDTQCYVDVNKATLNEKHFHQQTRWIVETRNRTNIKYVLHLGDITQHNTPQEWARARNIITELNGHVPYLLIPGNHDIGPGGNAYDRSTLMAGYFPIEEARRNTALSGVFKENDPSNVYHVLSAGGSNWLILGLEFGPRDEVVRWARKVVEDHPEHRLVLVTHAYLYDDDTRFNFKLKGPSQAGNPQYYHIMAEPGFANDGEQLWQAIVSKTKTPALVLSGHVLGDGIGLRLDSNQAGKNVVQMLVNFQQRKEGGEGYLRILEFNADNTILRVMDYSPSLDRFEPGPQSQFKVRLR